MFLLNIDELDLGSIVGGFTIQNVPIKFSIFIIYSIIICIYNTKCSY